MHRPPPFPGLTGLDLGDAVARVTRGASLWALVLSCFGLGTLLSLKANGRKFGGIMSVAGLFFYGSLLALFTDERTTKGPLAGALLFNIPDVGVPADGGPFAHLLGGHSVLHGLSAITAMMGLCLVERERESALTWRGIILLALPALAVAVNSVAALYCVGVVGILLFWGRLGAARSWLSIMLMFCLFLEAWKIMGYGNAPDAVGATIKAAFGLALVAACDLVHCWPRIPDRCLPLDITTLEGPSFCLGTNQCRGVASAFPPVPSQR